MREGHFYALPTTWFCSKGDGIFAPRLRHEILTMWDSVD